MALSKSMLQAVVQSWFVGSFESHSDADLIEASKEFLTLAHRLQQEVVHRNLPSTSKE